MTTIDEDLDAAFQNYKAGRLADAEDIYHRVLAVIPNHAVSLQSLGLIACRAGRYEVAIDYISQAIAVNPKIAEFYTNLGGAYRALGKLDEAVACYAEALHLKPTLAEAHNNLGNIMRLQGKLEQAVECYSEALRLKPDFAQARKNLGDLFRHQGRFEKAVEYYGELLRLKPNLAEAHNDLGITFGLQGKLEEAVAHYTKALSLNPGFAKAHRNLGVALEQQGKLEQAAACYAEALQLRPEFAEAHFNFAQLLRRQGKLEQARACFAEAARLKPDLVEAQWSLYIAQLPVIYVDAAEIETRRSAYEARLRELCQSVEDDPAFRRRLKQCIGISQPFYLPYQGRNDCVLQALYGQLLTRLTAEAAAPSLVTGLAGPEEPIRVGFISGFFRHHSVWKMPLKGWMTGLDRQRFRVFGYHTQERCDRETEAAAGICDQFVQGPLPVDHWLEVIRADAPHVLIFPELGMDSTSLQLAVHRLAPVQCTSWGHPTTSGLPTIDYFLSSDLMEPPDGECHYTERLVRLANLSVFYEPPPTAPVAIDGIEMGLRPEATLYWCCQSLYKYLPQFDEVFPRIAAATGNCQFCFIRDVHGEHVNAVFWSRLKKAFAKYSLEADTYCVLLPRLPRDRFVAMARACDVFLDSIGWSGCNSTMESLAHNLPVVTLPGSLMRGRHSAAILKMMGLTETIAHSIENYITLAARLGQDQSWRAAIQQQIAANKHKLYCDRCCIDDLEAFLERVGRVRLGSMPATESVHAAQ